MAPLQPPLAIQAVGVTNPAEEFRRALGTLLPAGGGSPNITDLSVTANIPNNNTVNVAAGHVWVPGTFSITQGPYYCYNDGAYNISISAKDATNPRRTLICAVVRDSNYSGLANNWDLIALDGTAAAVPVDPAIPATAVGLARIAVPSGVTALVITQAMITDISPALGTAYRCRLWRAGAFTYTATGSYPFGWDRFTTAPGYDPAGMSNQDGNGTITIKAGGDGDYYVSGQISCVAQVAGSFVTTSIYKNGVEWRRGPASIAAVANSNEILTGTVSDIVPCVAGDILNIYINLNPGMPILPGPVWNSVTLRKLNRTE